MKYGDHLESEQEPIIENYLNKYKDRVVLEIGIRKLDHFLNKKKICPNIVAVTSEYEFDVVEGLRVQYFEDKFLEIMGSERPYLNDKEKEIFDFYITDHILQLEPELKTKEGRIEWFKDSLRDISFKYGSMFEKMDRIFGSCHKYFKSLGLFAGDAKNLETCIDEESVDLALAIGLFGELDFFTAGVYNQDCDIKERAKKEIISTYKNRVRQVGESVHKVLKPNGEFLISNANNVELFLFMGLNFDKNFFKNIFSDTFAKIDIEDGPKRYLMICQK